MADKPICPICGEPTSNYMGNFRKDGLCKKHALELKNGQIVQCEKCGAWHYSNTPCECDKRVYTFLPIEGFSECLICGTKTVGYAFCRKCYNSHTEQEMLDILNKKVNEKKKASTESIFDKFSKAVETGLKIRLKERENEINALKEELIDNKNKILGLEKQIADVSQTTCLICGKPSYGYHFCKKHFSQFNNKIVFLKLNNLTQAEVIEAEYESDCVCSDGHLVKSRAEREIDDWFFDENIKHCYEIAYDIDGKHSFKPDWLLPKYVDGIDVYVEYFGIENSPRYESIKNYKLEKYKENHETVVIINGEAELKDIRATLNRKIKRKSNIKIGEINW